ncbi:MAG: NUDIX domain-containing protein [Rhodobacteraceae bacterium]|jgi:8-oxo-dGTP pyrophosphatase MutT (NUDIX family)|nr:NUDIX domain-containing protein [Paracoccaceae bacterium]PWL35729.1 MAG: NUDIX hydrolase [Marivita sp. XM-24bin2]
MAKKGQQIAALPMRWKKDGTFQVLMVTSRETKRWVMPKGWTMDGKKPWKAAEIEALEEAGAVGYIGREVLGTYTYKKRMDDGSLLKCHVDVYPMVVEKLKSNWKERKERKRKWFSAKGAAKRVNERQLSELLRTLEKKPAKQPVIREFLKAS